MIFDAKQFAASGATNMADYLPKIAQNQMQQFNQVNLFQQQQSRGMEHIKALNDVLSGLSKEEMQNLTSNERFVAAKNMYDAGFMEFLSQKYSNEYLASQIGESCAANLLNETKTIAEFVAVESKNKKDRVDKLLELLDRNPELLNQLEHGGNSKKLNKPSNGNA
jgi:hypothetical protein